MSESKEYDMMQVQHEEMEQARKRPRVSSDDEGEGSTEPFFDYSDPKFVHPFLPSTPRGRISPRLANSPERPRRKEVEVIDLASDDDDAPGIISSTAEPKSDRSAAGPGLSRLSERQPVGLRAQPLVMPLQRYEGINQDDELTDINVPRESIGEVPLSPITMNPRLHINSNMSNTASKRPWSSIPASPHDTMSNQGGHSDFPTSFIPRGSRRFGSYGPEKAPMFMSPEKKYKGKGNPLATPIRPSRATGTLRNIALKDEGAQLGGTNTIDLTIEQPSTPLRSSMRNIASAPSTALRAVPVPGGSQPHIASLAPQAPGPAHPSTENTLTVRDPSQFSLQPPTVFRSWSAEQYAALASAVTYNTRWIPIFAATHGKSVEEVQAVLRAAVVEPLRDAEEAARRVHEGIRRQTQSSRGVSAGGKTRVWGMGTRQAVVGKLVGVRRFGEVCVEVERREERNVKQTVVLRAEVLTRDDWAYLRDVCGGEDTVCSLLGFQRPDGL